MKKTAKFVAYFGMGMFVASLITQTVMLSRYPSIYYGTNWFHFLAVLGVPTLVAYGFIQIKYKSNDDSEERSKHLWIVWTLYVFTLLIPVVGLIFGGLREKLDRNQFFGPNILKITMCGSPVIALLLITSAMISDKNHYAIMIKVCWDIAMDLFDDIEVLEMILPQEKSETIPIPMDVIIIVCVFLDLSFSVIEMREKCDEDSEKSKWRIILQIFLVNLALLIIRLVVWLKYKHDASIFIAKNLMKIWISIIEILKLIDFF